VTRRPANAGDAGAVTVILLLLAGAFFGFAGLVWDGGRAITARQHAADLAEQAARAGADELDLAAVRGQDADAIDTPRAIADACRYVRVTTPGAECVATATSTAVTVLVTTRTPTVLLGLAGLSSLTTRGSATASAVHGVISGEVQP
jgi:Flp pilus assembly protein TadG